MAVSYGRGSTRITSSDVLAYYTNNMNNITSGDVEGGYEWYGTNTSGGCGSAQGDAGVLIVLKNNISWNRITCQFEFNGNSSCWTFLGGGELTNSTLTGGVFGRDGPNAPSEMQGSFSYNTGGPGNILPYNESFGDRIFQSVNSFGNSINFVRKASACDNDNTNFFHGAFNNSDTKSFWTTRRRNLNYSDNAGIWFGKSCSSVGSFVRIKNIFVWYEG